MLNEIGNDKSLLKKKPAKQGRVVALESASPSGSRSGSRAPSPKTSKAKAKRKAEEAKRKEEVKLKGFVKEYKE